MPVFSDEKDFTVAKHHNKHNDRHIAEFTKSVAPQLKYVSVREHPSKANVLGVLISDGKMLPHFGMRVLWMAKSTESTSNARSSQRWTPLMVEMGTFSPRTEPLPTSTRMFKCS